MKKFLASGLAVCLISMSFPIRVFAAGFLVGIRAPVYGLPGAYQAPMLHLLQNSRVDVQVGAILGLSPGESSLPLLREHPELFGPASAVLRNQGYVVREGNLAIQGAAREIVPIENPNGVLLNAFRDGIEELRTEYRKAKGVIQSAAEDAKAKTEDIIYSAILLDQFAGPYQSLLGPEVGDAPSLRDSAQALLEKRLDRVSPNTSASMLRSLEQRFRKLQGDVGLGDPESLGGTRVLAKASLPDTSRGHPNAKRGLQSSRSRDEPAAHRPSPAEGTTSSPIAALPPIPREIQQSEEALAALVDRYAERLQHEPLDAVVGDWVGDYAAVIPGAVVRYAADFLQYMQDQGDQISEIFSRPGRLGFVSYLGRDADYGAMESMFFHAFKEIENRNVSLGDTAYISGFTAMGGPHAGYRAAYRFPQVRRDGIMSAQGIKYKTANVHLGLVIGMDRGSESEANKDAPFVMIGAGGGGQAKEEMLAFLKEHPERAILIGGFHERKVAKDGGVTYVPGAMDQIISEIGDDAEALVIHDGHLDPAKTGRLIAERVVKLMQERVYLDVDSRLLSLSNRHAGSDLLELEQNAKALSETDRLLQIGSAVRWRLIRAAKLSPSHADQLAVEAMVNIRNRTKGIDNFKENSRWQEMALQALRETGGPIAEIIGQLAIDTMSASWDGVGDEEEHQEFFDSHVSRIPEAMRLPDDPGPHTFDKQKYARLRLRHRPYRALSIDPAPEIFLGSAQEMKTYFAHNGYPKSVELGESNGTRFFLFSGRGNQRKVVIQGVDSKSRMTQLAALMQTRGIDLDKFIVRGTLKRLQDLNTSLLRTELRGLDAPIGAVVLNDKNHAFEALAAAAGVQVGDLDFGGDMKIGPFKYRKIKVNSTEGKPYYILGFSPAYGELTGDLVRAAYQAGARNFMLAGAGESLIGTDNIGAIHNVVSSEYQGERIDLKDVRGVEVLKVPGLDAHNITSPTPLEQGWAWAKSARGRGAADVDQETFHAFKALKAEIEARSAAGAGLQGNTVRIQVGLFQSDVIGTGALEGGTVGADYGGAVRQRAGRFITRLGVGAVATKSGWAKTNEAVAGVLDALADTAPTLQGLRLPLTPDAATTLVENSDYDPVTQLKGQKRVIEIETGALSEKDLSQLKKLFRELKSKRFWVVARQSDPNYAQVLLAAKEYGFETILIRDSDEELHGNPNFILKAESVGQAQALYDRLIAVEQPNSYEPNLARHYRVYFGKAPPEQAPESLSDRLRSLDKMDYEDLAEEMNREARRHRRTLREEIEERFGDKAPGTLDMEDLADFFQGRKPILFSGAPKKAIALISKTNLGLAERAIRMLLASMDPKQHVIVTGATEFGIEKIVHRVAGQMGFDVLGTVVENTRAEEISPYVTHVIHLGINWFGKSRPVLMDIVKDFGGVVIFQGGGAILESEIELALRLKVPLFLQRGPEGAAADKARKYPQHGFQGFEDLHDRLLELGIVDEESRARAEAFEARHRAHAVGQLQRIRPQNLDAQRIHELLGRAQLNETEIDALIDAFKTDPVVAEAMQGDIGVTEGFTLEQHTRMVLRQFERYFTGTGQLDAFESSLGAGKAPSATKRFLRLFLILHDLGKPLAVSYGDKEAQHELTSPLLGTYLAHFGIPQEQTALAETLLNVDVIGSVLRAGAALRAARTSNYKNEEARDGAVKAASEKFSSARKAAASAVKSAAARPGIDGHSLLHMIRIFYMTDAGSYTTDAGGNYPYGGWHGLNHLFSFHSGSSQGTPSMAFRSGEAGADYAELEQELQFITDKVLAAKK